MEKDSNKSSPFPGPIRDKSPDGKTGFIGFRASKSERVAIEGRAAEAGITVSAFVRAAALGAKIGAKSTGEKIDPDLIFQLRKIGNNLNQCIVEARQNNFSAKTDYAVMRAVEGVSDFMENHFHSPKRGPGE